MAAKYSIYIKAKEGRLSIKSHNPLQTQQLGKELGGLLPVGSLVALIGELGVGKTCLTQGIIKGLGAAEAYITSPSYTLINEYHGRYPIYHFDLYRLSNPQQVEELGYEEYFFGRGVAIIEWAEKIRDLLPQHYLEVKLSRQARNVRQVVFTPYGASYQELVNQLCHKLMPLFDVSVCPQAETLEG